MQTRMEQRLPSTHTPKRSIGAEAIGAQAIGARSIGGFAVGALAVGAVAIGALALGRTLSSLLYGVTAADVTAFGAALILSVVTALFACLLPARRAASMNPLDGLRT